MDKTLNVLVSFTWLWDDKFFIETSHGNFVWSDPDYNGDNTLRRYNGNLQEYCRKTKIPFGRDKGKHYLHLYCRHHATNEVAKLVGE